MAEQDRYIPGVPCWVDTTQPDPEAAATFYGALFGWETEDVMPPEAPVRYYMARLRGGDVAAVGSQAETAPGPAVWNTYVAVQDAEETAGRVRDAGGTVLMEPGDVGDFGRMAVFADPAGAAFRVWQPEAHRGATDSIHRLDLAPGRLQARKPLERLGQWPAAQSAFAFASRER